jgi:hypothetical protein
MHRGCCHWSSCSQECSAHRSLMPGILPGTSLSRGWRTIGLRRWRASELIRRHPDYANVFLRSAAGDEASKTRWAFMVASVWPEMIRIDPRFYDDNGVNVQATPLLPGFPDMKRHADWRAYATPFRVDGTTTELPEAPSALTESRGLLAEISGSLKIAEPGYDVPWLVHIVSDVHSVECVSRIIATDSASLSIARVH